MKLNEKEWIASTNPCHMLEARGKRIPERKLRLFTVGCCRRVWKKLTIQEHRTVVELAERYADGLVKKREWQRARAEIDSTPLSKPSGDLPSLIIRWLVNKDPILAARYCCEFAAYLNVWESINPDYLDSLESADLDAARGELQQHALLLRCIAGTRYRLPRIKPAWLTSDVLALARGIYDDRAFDRMPILADALQDARCDNEDILSHCRDADQVHVRGCWVVDMVLGKK